MLQADGEVEVGRRDHRRRRQPLRDLLGVVGARENGDRPPRDDLRQAAATRRIEALGQDQRGGIAGQAADHGGERLARYRKGDEIRLVDRGLGDRRRGDPCEVDVSEVARIPSRLRYRTCLGGVPARERDVVPSSGEQGGEDRAPRSPADHADVHPRRT